MSSIMLTILNGVKTSLQLIQADDTVSVQGTTYTFLTDIGSNVKTGIDLRDAETSEYPAACINNIAAAISGATALPDCGLIASFSIEAGYLLSTGDDWLTKCDAMLTDIQAAVDLAPASLRGRMIEPAAGGRSYEFLKPDPGSKIALIRCWYSIKYQQQYRVTGLLG